MIARALVALLVLAVPAFAGDLSVVAQVTSPPGVTPVTFSFPQFNPAFGQLESVSISAAAILQGWIVYENLNPNACMSVSGNPYATGYVDCGQFSVFLSGWDNYGWFLFMQPFDGALDFAGPSSTMLDYSAGSPALWGGSGSLSSALVTAQSPMIGAGLLYGSWEGSYIGPSLGPCDNMFPPNVAVDDHHSVSLGVTITYHFAAYPARYCYGELAQMACPCPVPFLVSNGCRNSTGLDGADLVPSGHSSLSADDFALYANGMPYNTSVLFFQGTQQVSIQFGDGVRCVGGSTVRLGVKQASLGAATYPSGGDPVISVKGNVNAGVFRTYQAWFRDSNPFFCTPATFNVTSAVATVWTP
jgi:hypothetical protein